MRGVPDTRSARNTGSGPARVDPRAERSRTLGLEVAHSILVEEGWDAVTHLRVAERSGLHRATIYRHWPTSLDLVREVLARQAASTDAPPTGDLARDLAAALTRINRELRGPDLVPVLATLIDRAEWNSDIREIKVSVTATGSAALRALLAEAHRCGELRSGLEPALGVAQLVGPLLYRRLLTEEPITPRVIKAIVASFLDAWRTPLAPTEKNRR